MIHEEIDKAPAPKRQLTWLDLCCGLKGASQPAIDRGWKVVTVDIDARFSPTIVADVRALPLKPFHVDVLWASPVCTEFTKWGMPDSWQHSGRGWKEPKILPSMNLVNACRGAVDYFQPHYWIIENVMASRQFISPVCGPVRYLSPGHVLWGRLPGLIPPTKAHKWKLPPTPDRSALRAAIPYEIGEAIAIAVERRMGLLE